MRGVLVETLQGMWRCAGFVVGLVMGCLGSGAGAARMGHSKGRDWEGRFPHASRHPGAAGCQPALAAGACAARPCRGELARGSGWLSARHAAVGFTCLWPGARAGGLCVGRKASLDGAGAAAGVPRCTGCGGLAHRREPARAHLHAEYADQGRSVAAGACTPRAASCMLCSGSPRRRFPVPPCARP